MLGFVTVCQRVWEFKRSHNELETTSTLKRGGEGWEANWSLKQRHGLLIHPACIFTTIQAPSLITVTYEITKAA